MIFSSPNNETINANRHKFVTFHTRSNMLILLFLSLSSLFREKRSVFDSEENMNCCRDKREQRRRCGFINLINSFSTSRIRSIHLGSVVSPVNRDRSLWIPVRDDTSLSLPPILEFTLRIFKFCYVCASLHSLYPKIQQINYLQL